MEALHAALHLSFELMNVQNATEYSVHSEIMNDTDEFSSNRNILDPMEDDTEYSELSPVYDIIYQLVLAIGILGNLLNLLVLSRPSLRGVTYVYLFWLALSDLLFLLVHSMVYIWLYFNPTLTFNYLPTLAVCLSVIFSETFSASSAFIVTLLTIDRHRAICTPFRCKETTSRQRACIYILLSFVLAIGIYGPVVLMTDIKTEALQYEHTDNGTARYDTRVAYGCAAKSIMDEPLFKIYAFLRELLARAVPIVLVTGLNIRIILSLRQHWKDRVNIRCSADDKNRAIEERRLVYLLAVIVVMFIVCTTPQAISWLIAKRDTIDSSYAYEVFDSIGQMLVAINAACNFYLYCFCSKAVRKAIVDLLRELCNAIARTATLVKPKYLANSGCAPYDGLSLATTSSQATQQTAVSNQWSEM